MIINFTMGAPMIRSRFLIFAVIAPLCSSVSLSAQPAEDPNIDPAPSGRSDTEVTVYPDGITITMPGADADTPPSNPVDWGDWQPGHDDDTTVVFKPETTTPEPPSDPPAPEPEPDPELR